ncbi:MAG: helix-turn-helix transcriptional regulator [Coriobacteriales bacterium]|nr:helix-turn-helix transcriptional regulator [Coriobacteriales bacterium]
MVSTFFHGGTLLSFAYFHNKGGEVFLFNITTCVVAVFLCSIGVILQSFASSELFAHLPAAAIGAALTGLGSAPVLLMISCLFVKRGEETFIVLLLAFLSSNVLVALIILLPPMAILAIVILLQPAIIILVQQEMKRASAEEPPRKQIKENLGNYKGLLFKLFMMVFVFNAGNGQTKSMSVGYSTPLLSASALIFTTLLAGVIFLCAYSNYRRFNTIALYRTTMLLFVFIGLGTLLVPNPEGIARSMIGAGTTIFRALFYVIEYQICMQTRLSPLLVFGIGESVKKIPVICVSIITAMNPSLLKANMVAYFIVAAICYITVYALVFTEKDLATLTTSNEFLSAKEQLELKCRIIAEECGLSDRELAVLTLLGQGRNTARIAEELFLAPGTVNVYMRKLYQKMGIHSKQEALDRIESTRI